MAAAVINAVLLAHEASDLEAFQRAPCATDPGLQRFIVLGRFDHLILHVGESAQPIVSGLAAAGNARSAISCAYAGHMLAPDGFQPAECAATHPILGFCSLRLARRALKEARSFDFLRHFMEKEFSEAGDIKWAVASTTGWEDVIVLLFGKSFNEVNRAVGKLRGMHAANACLPCTVDTEDGFHHLVLTSCTLPALACRWHGEWTSADTESLLARVRADECLHWAIRVEIYPGHWDACAALLRQRCFDEGIAVDITPLFGQADLRISPVGDEAATHRGLIKLLTQVIFPLEVMPNTVLRTVETRLIPGFAGYEEDVGAGHKSTRKIRQLAPDLAESFRSNALPALHAMGTPPHTLRALEETMDRLQGMAHDRLHGEEFHTLHRLATTFIDAVVDLRSKSSTSDPHYEEQVRTLLRDISDWQLYLERCIADRFRGPYPAGDNMMVRIGSHHGTHHRFLVVMDHFAQKAYDLARTRINEKLGVAAVPKAALATFMGNSPSAYATSHTISRLHCGFTDLPATLVQRIQDCHLVAHETGHHVIRAFFSKYPVFEPFSQRDRHASLSAEAVLMLEAAGCNSEEIAFLKNSVFSDWRTLRELRELLADLFAAHLCFPNDQVRHTRAADQTVAAFYESDFERVFLTSVLSEFRLRHLAMAALLGGGDDTMQTYRQQARDFIERDVAGNARHPLADSKFDNLKQCAHRIGNALTALLSLRRTREISALLDGLAACAGSASFIGESDAESLLTEIRHFLADGKAPSPVENYAFLDRLWFMVLRKQEGILT